MADVWSFFQEYHATGAFSTAGWIRPGHFSGASFAWDGEAIPFPDLVFCNTGTGTYTGYIAVDTYDDSKLWVAALCDVGGGVKRTRCYVYDRFAETWTLLLDLAFTGPTFPFVLDIAFGVGVTFLAIGGNGALGLSGACAESGVYMSVAYGAFTTAGSGHEHGYRSGNINAPASLTALDLSDDGAGHRNIYTAHSLTRLNDFTTNGWVTSSSADDGATWHDPVPFYGGNKFMLEALTMMRLGGSGGGLFYVADHSGSGAYSTSGLSARLDGTPTNGPTGGLDSGIFQSGSIAHTFPSDGNKAVAYPTSISTTMELVNSSNGGSTWNRQSQGLGHGAFAYRGGRTSRTTLDTAGISKDNPTHNSEIFWSEDAGVSWHSALAESTAIGLSLDFGSSAPEVKTVNLQTMTFRDSRMFVGQSRFYVRGATDTELHDNAEGMSNLLDVLSNALLTGTVGPYSSPPIAPGPGVPEVYQNIEMVIRLTWITDDGVAIGIDVPAPLQELFIDDQESYVLLSPFIADVAAGAMTYKVCTRGGQLAVSFIGATRIMRGFRATQTIRTLDPSETFTGE